MLRSPIALCLAFLLTACGGGGDSTPSPAIPPAPTGSFSRTVPGDNENITGFLDANPQNHMHWQNLYRAPQVAGAGLITGISLQYNNTQDASASCPTLTIRLSHSGLPEVAGTFSDNLDNGRGRAITVLSGKTVTFPAGAKETWHRIDFDTPFYYNGVDSLVVDFDATGPFGGRLLDACDTDLDHLCTVFNSTPSATTGATARFLQRTQFHFKGGDCAFVTEPDPNSLPFTNEMDVRKIQVLYRPSEVGGSGPIRGLGFQVASTTTLQTYTLSLKVGHTTLSEPGNSYADNFNAGAPVTVADRIEFTLPAGIPEGSCFWIPWTGAPFTYNGTQNLLLELEVTSPSGVVWLASRTTPEINRILAVPGSAVATARDGCQYGIKFRFAGGNVEALTSGEGSVTMPFNSASGNKSQHLYRAAELGTRGRITRLALRMHTNTSDAVTFGDFTVRLGHASPGAASGLNNAFASNLAEGSVEAFRGTFTVPAGLRYGDWLEIPLTTPFVYDASRNLVLQVSAAPGLGGCPVSLSGDSAAEQARYSHCHAGALSSGAENATTVTHGIFDLRLILE